MISQIDIYRFRNLSEAHLSFRKSNLLVGRNGSGKTSVLEAAHTLAYGKSFRGVGTEQIINNEEKDLVVRGQFDGANAGIQRFRNGKFSIRLNGEDVKRVSELSRLLPIHVVDPNSIALVEGSPTERRRFLDFTMFHVEHSYLQIHKRFTEALKQRNALLKSLKGAQNDQLKYWDGLFIETAWELHRLRLEIFENVLSPSIRESCALLLKELDIDVEYYPGFKSTQSLDEFGHLLLNSRDQDMRFGSSQLGPHRADILLKHKGKLAKDYLSRGQKKLLTYGVRLAPALALSNKDGNVGSILIDDMPSELDEVSVEKVCQLLDLIDSQTILSAVDETNKQVDIIREHLKPKMFHVEHGSIRE